MKKYFIIPIVILSLFFTWGCNNQNKSDNKNEKEVIKIGVILPLTGELASYGDPIILGIKMAVEKRNDSTFKFEVKVSDSKGEGKTAISAINHMLNIEDIKYFIGDVSSPVTLAILPIIEKNSAFLMCPGASSPELGKNSKLFVRNYPSSTSESKESARFIIDSLGFDKAAIIYVNSDYGIGLKEAFVDEYNKNGGNVNFIEKYKFGNSNFREIILKLIKSKDKVVYLGGNQKEMGYFTKQLREYTKNIQIVSNISFLSEDCLNIAGEASNGVIVPVAYYNPNDSTSIGVKKFTKLYTNKFNKKPSVLNAIGYDAANLIINGILAKGLNTIDVANYLRKLKNYDGALGRLSFEKGEVSIPIQFKYIENGKAIILQNIDNYKLKYANKISK